MAINSIARIIVSGLAINLSTFCVLALGPILLSTSDFAKLTLTVAWSIFGATLLDLGLGIGAVRQYANKQKPAYLSLLIRSKLLIIALIYPPSFVLTLYPETIVLGVSGFCAASLNLWSGLRAVEQAHENYTAYSNANFTFAIIRMLFGSCALVTGNWIAVSISIFVLPIFSIALIKYANIIKCIKHHTEKTICSTFRYSIFVYLSALGYNATVYLPQTIAANRLDDIAVGSLGIAAICLGPIGLINNALRVYLLPKISSGKINMLDNPLVNLGLFYWIIGFTFMGVLLAGVTILGQYIYGSHFPQVWIALLTIVGAYLIVVPLGLLNMHVHNLGRPALEAIVNISRLIVAIPVIWFTSSSLTTLVITSATVIVLGEIALFVVIRSVKT